MSSPTSTIARWLAGRAPIAAATVLFASGLALAPSASAGTYPMYQCAPGVPAVSPGWSVFGNTTNANTVLSNTCSAGGSIGDYVFTDGQAGAVTENGESGSQVGLRIDVPGSAPGVTIHAIKAEVIASAVTRRRRLPRVRLRRAVPPGRDGAALRRGQRIDEPNLDAAQGARTSRHT